jgi:hypothetical protein
MAAADNNELLALIKQLAQSNDIEGVVALAMDMAKQQADMAKQQADMAKQQADMAKQQADMAERCDAAEEDARAKAVYIKHLVRLLFGRRSEKLTGQDLRQLSLALGVPEAQADQEPDLPRS